MKSLSILSSSKPHTGTRGVATGAAALHLHLTCFCLEMSEMAKCFWLIKVLNVPNYSRCYLTVILSKII